MAKYYEDDDYVLFKSGYLSQWHEAPFTIDNITFNCCEQWMMYKKAIFFYDAETANKILEEKIPKEQKKLGRSVKNFNEDEWSEVDTDIVFQGNLIKFAQNPELKEKLLATGNKHIIEASSFDSKWGAGKSIDEFQEIPKEEWKKQGRNLLGKALMCVRKELPKL